VIIGYRWIWFTIAAILLLGSLPYSQSLHLDRSLERMFPEGDPDRLAFERLEAEFGVSHFLVFAYRDKDLWSSDGAGIDRAAEVRKSIESIHGVSYALDLSRVDEMLSTLRGPSALLSQLSGKRAQHPLVDPKNQLAERYRDLFSGQTHSKNTDLVAIGVLLDPSVETSRALEEIRTLSQSTTGGLLVGHLAMVDEGFREIEQDGNRLAIYSTISLILLILIGFRSWRWALITIAVVQWSLVVTRAILVLLDWELTMVSSMLSSIVMVVGVATTMHWMFGYQSAYEEKPGDQESINGISTNANAEELQPRQHAEKALRASMNRLWIPIVGACVTDAIGFGSLLLSRVGPVQDYGSMMAIACSVVLAGIFMIVPTLALIGPNHRSTKRSRWDSYRLGIVPGEEAVQSFLTRILDFVCNHRRSIYIGALAVLVWSILGSARLKVETDFLKNFQSESPISHAYRAVETELGGAGIWDVMLPAPDRIEEAYFDSVEALEKKLLAIEIAAGDRGETPLQLTSAMSLADTDHIARDASVLKMVPIEARLLGMRQVMGSFFDTLLSGWAPGSEKGDKRYLRIMLRSRERSGANQKDQLIAMVNQTVAQHVAAPAWQRFFAQDKAPDSNHPKSAQSQSSQEGRTPFLVSGYYVLLTRLVENVVADQWVSFLCATLGIGIAMAVALRSVKLAMIAILPSALPNMVVLGTLGWNDIHVNLGAAMIAAVSMGLGVDSSLHYLYRYRCERLVGKSSIDALRVAQSETGLAVLMATLALVLGFGTMAFSNFLPTFAFGTLAAWTMLGGLVGNLCLLPAILYGLDRKNL
jgi:predicted RND superfamily exporter protein